MKQYTQEEFWKLYEKLSQELKDAIFSGETAEHIGNICKRYNIEGGTVFEVAERTRNVLLGLLPPNDLRATLEEELKLEKEIAEKVSKEIGRFIFYPVKPELEQLYGVEKTNDGEMSAGRVEQKQNKTAGEDRYREVIG
ncbi:MAG: hypothetical protein Q8P74_01030 [bacterium]|nr:hypothetical protein [bacterium]